MPDIKPAHDGTLEIATGKHRRETSWKNKKTTWGDLLVKLSKTHRTAETYAEYIASKKMRQDEIKDVGGFVGGYLAGGRRKGGSVSHRQLITLDLDFATAGVWDDFTMLYGNAAAMYSTHKHTPSEPRVRLVMPLDREVMADEYVAISRRIAETIGIEQMDPTTYQPERLMYWPSTAKDAEYLFEWQDGSWISADSILATYTDWRDSSEWPMSKLESSIPMRAIKKQGDPLEKPGVVGAFCRTHTIAGAIEKYLSDVYEETVIPGRWTYKEGSTAGGLVVYDDKYAYSHHGTDPVSGKLCNAFDLVRLHKFGPLDADDADAVKVTALPSYKRMIDLAVSDEQVSKQRSDELLQHALRDFTGEPEDEETETALGEAETSDEWRKELQLDSKGNFANTIDNIRLILMHDPLLKGRIYLNEFEGRMIITRNLPWRKVTKNTRDFTDDDADCLAHYLEQCKMPFNHIPKALATHRTKFKMHPVREYLDAQVWDGEPRVDSLFIDYLGAEDNLYTRTVARKALVASVARVFEPGCKFDNMPTLIGPEGVYKSTLIAKLGGEWFSDCLGDVHGKEGMESLRGVWLMEIAELSALRKADQEAVKRFTSSTVDIYRPAYGKQLVRFPRQCTFWPTSNKYDFLAGPDKHRRFWPIKTRAQEPTKWVFEDLTPLEIGQIWAEAVHYYKAGETLYLPDDVAKLADAAREEHREVDDRAGIVEKYLSAKLPENWAELSMYDRRSFISGEGIEEAGTVDREFVCVAEIWCEALGCMHRDMNAQNTKFIHDIMKKMPGWEATNTTKRFGAYGPQRAYKNTMKNGSKNDPKKGRNAGVTQDL